ncbi:MAG: ABC transporter permease [Chloroflexota bacterium]|nr:ABC transporter permease [Chloroflexota bacterium]
MRRSPEVIPAAGPPVRSRLGRARIYLLFVVGLLVVWEAAKFIGGDPWRYFGWEWRPPLKFNVLNDQGLPHVWDIVGTMIGPYRRNADQSLFVYLLLKALYTWREAAIGFVLGGALGMALAAAFVHSQLLERAFVPYVVASQTIPIVALAPMIVFFFGNNVLSVVIIATYLTFFPVTIAMIRGLRSPDPRALELMRSFAASRRTILWKLRLPASLPYLFTALKITATASIVGAIIGEGPGAIQGGLGWSIIEFNQQYITNPSKLWGAIFVAALLGVSFYSLVRLVELRVLRGRPEASAG